MRLRLRVCSGLPASPRVLTRPSEARDRSGRRDSGRNSCGRTGGRRSVQRAAATERGVCDGNGDAIELWHGAGAVAVAHALHAATHGLAGAGVQDKAAGCRQWTDCSEGAVALRCAASCGAGSSVVSGVVSLQRAPVVRHDRRAGQWARDALVKLQPVRSLDADKRGVEPPGSWLELGQHLPRRNLRLFDLAVEGGSGRIEVGAGRSSTNDAHSHGSAARQFLVGPARPRHRVRGAASDVRDLFPIFGPCRPTQLTSLNVRCAILLHPNL